MQEKSQSTLQFICGTVATGPIVQVFSDTFSQNGHFRILQANIRNMTMGGNSTKEKTLRTVTTLEDKEEPKTEKTNDGPHDFREVGSPYLRS